MNVAILIVHFDTISQKYECDLTYVSNHDKPNNELYISQSPKVNVVIAKFAVGRKEIRELEVLKDEYLEKNHKPTVTAAGRFGGTVEEMKCDKCEAVTGQGSAWTCTICNNKK